MKMKKLMNLSFVLMLFVIVSSCVNNTEQQNYENHDEATRVEQENKSEKHYSYRLLEKHDGYREDSLCGIHFYYDNGNLLKGLVICYGDATALNYVMFDDEENYYNDCIFEWTMALRIADKLYSRNKSYYTFENGRIEESENLLIYRDENSSSAVMYRISPNGDTVLTFYPRMTYLYRDTVIAPLERRTREPYAIYNSGDTLRFGDTILKYYYRIDKDENNHIITNLLDYIYCLPDCIEEYYDKEIVELFKKTYYDFKDESIYTPEKGYGFRKYPIDIQVDYNRVKCVELFRIKEGEFDNVPGGALGIRFNYDYY